MKVLNLVFVLLLFCSLKSLGQKFVLDKEGLLTVEERKRVDSILGTYNKLPVKVLLMGSDTLNPRSPNYYNELFRKYFSDSTSKDWVMMLVLSRKNQVATMIASKPLIQRIKQEDLVEMIRAGAPSLQAQKREEGITLILRSAMEFLDKLPGHQLP